MNTNILTKCIEELKKETPDLSYLRGMLETLVEMQGGQKASLQMPTTADLRSGPSADETAILDAKARAAIDVVKAMGGQNNPQ